MKLNIQTLLIFLIWTSVATNSTWAQEEEDSTTTEALDPMEQELLNLNLSAKKNINTRSIDDPIKFFDMGVYSTQKPFKSSKVQRYSLWERIENDCGLNLEEIPIELTGAFENIPRTSQSSIFDLVKGNVKISNQIISPTERQFMHSPFLTPGSSSRIFGCLTGTSYREENFILNNVSYFGLVLANLAYLKEELQYSYNKNGHAYSCDFIRSKDDIEDILKDPSKVGILVSIGGGHSLGNFLYIEQGQVATEEYQALIVDNIRQLKGSVPIAAEPEEFLDIPIFSVSFGNYFEDGICGKTNRFSLAEEEAFKRPTNIDADITPLGQVAVKELLNKDRGRRILVDIGGMSILAREWYYKHVKDERFRKDTIPILATGVGISGLNKKDNLYGKLDKNEFFNHQSMNLCRQDLMTILESEGLIGISLERNKLMGPKFQERYNATVPNSADRYRVATEAVAANICKAIHMSNNIDAWNMICISTEFDAHGRYLDVYNSSNKMLDLHRHLLAFFSNPRDIKGIYTAKEIQNFMYNYTAEEIVDRIMYKNALKFTKKHLQEIR